MQTMKIPPDTNSYAIGTASDDAVEILLDGGASRRRADKDMATRILTVQWTTGPNGYNYLQAFYRKATRKGSMPFLCPLINDSADVLDYKCWFVGKTFVLAGQTGRTYTCQASIEVVPMPINDAYDQSIIDVYSAYGDEGSYMLDRLSFLVNVKLPACL
jgi:hypothetical protein